MTIQGAGQWYTVLHSNNSSRTAARPGNIHLKNFAVFGEITERNDGSPDNAFHGVLGANSSVTGPVDPAHEVRAVADERGVEPT